MSVYWMVLSKKLEVIHQFMILRVAEAAVFYVVAPNDNNKRDTPLAYIHTNDLGKL